MKILVLAANPLKTERLHLEKEMREIQASLERSKLRDQFIIKPQMAVRATDLRRALLDHDPQIVHFCGHGVENAGIILEDETGSPQIVSTNALASLFRLFSGRVCCVILNSCYSNVQAIAIHKHIDCVIGMEKAIGDKAAIEFSTGFYDALGAQRQFQDAFDFGCSAIDLEGIPEAHIPKLLIRDPLITSLLDEAKEKKKGKDQYVLVLNGKLDSDKKDEAEIIVEHLRELLGDSSLTLKKVESGSIILVLEGDDLSFQELEKLIECGQLTEIQGHSIRDISELQWFIVSRIANDIAQSLVMEKGDINELMKCNSYLRSIVNSDGAKDKFFAYLKLLVRNGQDIGHSKRTTEYYRSVEDVCKRYLSDSSIDAQMMLSCLGWAARLVRYYKTTNIDQAATNYISDRNHTSPIQSQRQREIKRVVSKSSFEIGTLLEAVVKGIKGNKVTYELMGVIRLTQKEPKLLKVKALEQGQEIEVEIVALREDGSIKKVKVAEKT